MPGEHSSENFPGLIVTVTVARSLCRYKRGLNSYHDFSLTDLFKHTLDLPLPPSRPEKLRHGETGHRDSHWPKETASLTSATLKDERSQKRAGKMVGGLQRKQQITAKKEEDNEKKGNTNLWELGGV